MRSQKALTRALWALPLLGAALALLPGREEAPAPRTEPNVEAAAARPRAEAPRAARRGATEARRAVEAPRTDGALDAARAEALATLDGELSRFAHLAELEQQNVALGEEGVARRLDEQAFSRLMEATDVHVQRLLEVREGLLERRLSGPQAEAARDAHRRELLAGLGHREIFWLLKSGLLEGEGRFDPARAQLARRDDDEARSKAAGAVSTPESDESADE
jgi:hypothetical protein